MLTKFHSKSSFKKKFTVVAIWIIALAMMLMLVQFLVQTKISFLWLIPIIIAGLFVISGILLRCKIARWFTLLAIYTFVFYPLVRYIMIGEIFPLTLSILYIFIMLISAYSLSNKKAMDLFYIESNPSEHLSLILLSLTINTVYIYLVKVV
ncbi:hypothetical protein MNB_SV-14-1075 [hydrothermal vent metagenome]|uniref:Uncharacterized protein n=1 Tax=hydrothermal vent metagenome TaxID=652676 RepID=A0A1W1CNB4_9ZZZZ